MSLFITDDEVRNLQQYVGSKIALDTADISYHFAEVGVEKMHCSGRHASSRLVTLRKVWNGGIVIDSIMGNDEEVNLSESRIEGSSFLGGNNAETYSHKIIEKIVAGEEVVFSKSSADFLPIDIGKKIGTYKSVPLPPSMD